VLDHHITDCLSSLLFEDGVRGGAAATEARRGNYREWVDWQLARYPVGDAATAVPPAHDFWLRYFDGGAPDRATLLPFCTPEAAPSGFVQVVRRDLPVPTETLRRAAAGLACTPFLLVIASLAAVVGELTDDDDVVIRYIGHGRTSRVTNTLGWFADQVPLRIRTPTLADPRCALRAAVSAWLTVIEHETTPWGYVLKVCGATELTQPQLVVSHLPRLPVAPDAPGSTDLTDPGSPGHLYLTVGLPHTGIGWIECRFDPRLFAPDGVDIFVGLALDRLARLTGRQP
jgi:hypothetical protein